MQELHARMLAPVLVKQGDLRQVIERGVVTGTAPHQARPPASFERAHGRRLRDADWMQNFGSDEIPQVRRGAADRFQVGLQRRTEQEIILVTVAPDRAGLPRIRLHGGDAREFVRERGRRVPAIVVAVQVAVEAVVRVRVERTGAAEAARHVGEIDEPDVPEFLRQPLDQIAGAQVQYLRAVQLREPQQRQRRGHALHHRAHAEAHFQWIRKRPVGCRRLLVVQHAAAHQRGRHLPLRQQRPAESCQRARRQIAHQFLPGPSRQPMRQFIRIGPALCRPGTGRNGRNLRRGVSPGDEMLMQQIRRRLLHELKSHVAQPRAAIQERRNALVRVVLGVVDQHQHQRGARPAVVGRFAPDFARLGDDAPVTQRRCLVPPSEQSSTFHGHERVAVREQ